MKIFFGDGKAPAREEEMTLDWVWTITDESLPTPDVHVPTTPIREGNRFIGRFVSGFIGALLMGYISYIVGRR